MIDPEKVAEWAQWKEEENAAFRVFLKGHADPKELDRQFLALHRELFSRYDCNACRNCCKQYRGCLSGEETEKCAEKLGLSPDEFKAKYLYRNPEGTYETNHMPCDFLQADGSCLLGECKPVDCADYPFTARPDRISCLLGILDAVFVCPVVYEMMERLKKTYGFVHRRNKRRY